MRTHTFLNKDLRFLGPLIVNDGKNEAFFNFIINFFCTFNFFWVTKLLQVLYYIEIFLTVDHVFNLLQCVEKQWKCLQKYNSEFSCESEFKRCYAGIQNAKIEWH